jgi:hypothetical protein
MELECSEFKSSVDSENRDKTWENKFSGRESSLCRWSSITETIQFAESDSSRHTDDNSSGSIEADEGRVKEFSASRSSTDGDVVIRTDSYLKYSNDEFELDYSFLVCFIGLVLFCLEINTQM